jgi:hypothetical protein
MAGSRVHWNVRKERPAGSPLVAEPIKAWPKTACASKILGGVIERHGMPLIEGPVALFGTTRPALIGTISVGD